MFQIHITNISGSEKYVIPFDSFKFTEELNKGYDGQIKVSYPALKTYATLLKTTPDDILTSKFREVKIYSDTDLIFLGILRRRKLKGGKVGATEATLPIADYLSMLAKRRTSEKSVVSNTDSAQIVLDELDISQAKTNGDLGITHGTEPTTINRDNLARFESLLELLVSMSNLKLKDGYDFDIDVTKALNFYYPTKGTTRENIVLDDFNILEWEDDVPLAGSLTNNVDVLGDGSDDDLIWTNREDASVQAAWLLHEDVIKENSVKLLATLQDRGDKFLDKNKTPSAGRIIKVTHLHGDPSITTYNVGDYVKVRINDIDLDENRRVIKREVEFKSGQAVVTCYLEA